MARLVYRGLDVVFVNSGNINMALGVVFGLHLGLIAPMTLQWMFAFYCILIFRINLATTLLSAIFFGTIGTAFQHNLHELGLRILTGSESLYSYWGWMHHLPIVPFTAFNHTEVMGETLIAYSLSLPLLIITLKLTNPVRTLLGNIWYSTKVSRSYAHYASRRK